MTFGHLSHEELLALAEAPALPDVPHLAACPRCRGEIVALRRVLADVRALDVPEPSPLFWDHLSERIHAAVVAAPIAAREGVAWRRWLGWASPLAAAVVLLLVVGLQRTPMGSASTSVTRVPVTMAEDPVDADWQLLLDIVGDRGEVTGDDLLPLPPRPGAADLLIAELSGDEREALATLLREELGS